MFSPGYFLDKLSKKSLCFVILGKKRMLFRREKWRFKKPKKSKFSIGIFFGQIKPEIIVF